ncbi:MAG: DUF2029 domain-containing protein [Microbacteriaceae bacterium]|nr:DUF2029 domain-containing protein [Microbacteriaceae bacterium]MCI1207745.1 DUF2029 domain-containing protein [Microbacteriaceae bacterium]
MTIVDEPRSRSRAADVARGIFSSGPILLLAFLLAHLVVGLLGLGATGWPLSDVSSVYRAWSWNAVHLGHWPGINVDGVYPVLAILPMLAPMAVPFLNYTVAWLLWLTLADVVALLWITRGGMDARRVRLGWFWVLFLLLLGPVALGRIDAVCVPLVLVAVDLRRTRPILAGVLLAIGGWIKIWPVAIFAAIFVTGRRRWRLLAGAAGLSLGVIGVGLLLGSPSYLFSFVTGQTGRRLQVEAVTATPWLWAARGDPSVYIQYNNRIYTNEIVGGGSSGVSAALTPIQFLCFVAIAMLAFLAVRRGASRNATLAHASLGLVLALIVWNKVGSPQFETWLLVPALIGLAVLGRGFLPQGIVVLVIAGLTQVIYPYLYTALLGLEPAMLLVITVRNVLLFGLLCWEAGELLRLGRADGRARVSLAA